MGCYDQKVTQTSQQYSKLIWTHRIVILLLCLSSFFLACKSHEVSSIDVSKNEAEIKVLKEESYVSSNINLKSYKSKRFRRNPSPNPLAEVLGSSSINSGSNFRISQDQVQNSHKPIFERCDEYQPSVEEESARGKILNLTHIWPELRALFPYVLPYTLS